MQEEPAQQRKQELGLKDEDELQSYFVRRMEAFLNAKGRRLIGWDELFRGTLTQTSVYPREVVKRALACNAAAVILAHNHPSGDPTPSSDDVTVTRAIVQAGKLLDVDVLDHLVIGSAGKWVSMKERGLGFT